ncbi:MAG TPA: hypothetical protein VII91_06320 [Bauldia sp.]
MTTLPFKLSVDPAPTQFLLTVRGSLAASTRDAGRLAHNQVAGSDEAVAMARSFGDLSHAVYVPTDAPAAGAGELLIIDYWNSVEGLMTFFTNEQVQTGGKLVFKADRENIIWQSTPGLPDFNLPAPMGKNERYVGLAQGPIKSREAAEKVLSEMMRKAANTNRAKGLMSREWFFRMSRPGEKPSLEAIGVDVWFDAAGMQEVYADPDEFAGFGDLFTARPATSAWQKPSGAWVEW